MRILLVSPYHTGSHKAWAEGYAQSSRHEVRLLTLPGRYWKWRMHGGGVTLARSYLEKSEGIDLILVTDMLDLTTFLALTRSKTSAIPAVLYMHENQLTYPLPEDPSSGPMRRQRGERDLHYGFINYASMLAADHLVFNSEYHRDELKTALPRFLKQFPEERELTTLERVFRESSVMPVGIHCDELRVEPRLSIPDEPPLIIWNQRWEYDKNPEQFFRLLFEIQDAGLPFRLALCGEVFERQPSAFNQAVQRLHEKLIHVGFAESDLYHHLLREAEITVSTARHEFFGISIVEAIACGTFPILPSALSYPEIVPVEFHPTCFYSEYEEMAQRLRWVIENRAEAMKLAARLSTRMSRFCWSKVAFQYDQLFSKVRCNR